LLKTAPENEDASIVKRILVAISIMDSLEKLQAG